MLQKITIQNFRSLKNVSLNLQDVNVLIGANNSGKTNLLRALYFLHQFDNINEESLENIFFSLVFKPDVALEILFTFEFFKFRSPNNIASYIFSRDFNKKKVVLKMTKTEGFDGPIKELYFRNIHLYQPDSSKLSKPAPLTSDTYVKADASNLVSFLDNMNGAFRKKVFNRIETDLKQCINEFEEINLLTVDLNEVERTEFGKDKDKTFKKLGLTDKFGNKYWAEELSEGTLYFLALLAIIHQPNPPKLLLLEEPERGIHPRRIKEVMDFIFRLASEKQIQVILTTHSPIVLDCFRDYPEKVFVFDKDEEGATQIKNLETDILIPLEEKEIANGLEPSDYTRSMGTNWEAGFFGGVPKNSKVPAK